MRHTHAPSARTDHPDTTLRYTLTLFTSSKQASSGPDPMNSCHMSHSPSLPPYIYTHIHTHSLCLAYLADPTYLADPAYTYCTVLEVGRQVVSIRTVHWVPNHLRYESDSNRLKDKYKNKNENKMILP